MILGWTPPALALKALPYLIGAGVLALLFAAGMRAGYAMEHSRRVAAEQKLSNYIEVQSALAKAGESEAQARSDAANAALRSVKAEILTALSSGLANVKERARIDTLALQGAINEPKFDCLRTVPLPDDYLGVLRRPGSSGANADR